MNKILKKRIKEACIAGSKQYSDTSKYSKVGYIRGFNEGAEYALSHQWISVEEALPESEDGVIVMYDIGLIEVRKGIYVRANKPLCESIKITHWLPIPKFETKESK